MVRALRTGAPLPAGRDTRHVRGPLPRSCLPTRRAYLCRGLPAASDPYPGAECLGSDRKARLRQSDVDDCPALGIEPYATPARKTDDAVVRSLVPERAAWTPRNGRDPTAGGIEPVNGSFDEQPSDRSAKGK